MAISAARVAEFERCMVRLGLECAYGTERPTGDRAPDCVWCPVRQRCRKLWDHTSDALAYGEYNKKHIPDNEVMATWERQFAELRKAKEARAALL